MTTLDPTRTWLGDEPELQDVHLPHPPVELQVWRVHEGPEEHIVIAEDAAQARGIAFGHRFADPDEWGDEPATMEVEAVTFRVAARMIVRGDDSGPKPTTLAYELSVAAGPVYLGGSLR
jgi:hypothetical protein